MVFAYACLVAGVFILKGMSRFQNDRSADSDSGPTIRFKSLFRSTGDCSTLVDSPMIVTDFSSSDFVKLYSLINCDISIKSFSL